MSVLSELIRCLERCHRKLGAVVAILGVLTYFLKQSYVGQQRDLLYWMDLLMLVKQPLNFFCFLTLVMIFTQLLLFIANPRIDYRMEVMLSKLTRKYRQRKFADFIVRRLLWQLELAMLGMSQALDQDLFVDPSVQQHLQLAKDSAYRAVDVFRRDAAVLLFDTQSSPSEDISFFILEEEELDLFNAGYSKISLHVTKNVLKQLLYP